MKKIFGKAALFIFLIIGIGLLYHFRLPLFSRIQNVFRTYSPCQTPITYSIGAFDEKFGITKNDFLKTIHGAETLWEKPIGKELYQYKETGGEVTINLIYDYRQKATDELKRLGIKIETTQAGYNSLKAHYSSLFETYNQEKAAVALENQQFEKDKKAYETQVAYWNARGGAPQKEYQELTAEKEALTARAKELDQKVTSLNEMVNEINATVTALNQLARDLNIKVTDYNSIGANVGSEFKEGEYVFDGSSKKINIYQFSNTTSLFRLLAHELGHAVGLQHVNAPNAIMYYLNESGSDKVSSEDLSALRTLCGIPN